MDVTNKPPRNIKVTLRGMELEILLRWSDLNPIALAIAGGVLGWLVFWHLPGGSLSMPDLDLLRAYFSDFMNEGLRPVSIVVPAIVLFACALIYSTIAHIFNRTRICVSDERIVIRHGPVPWLGNKAVDVKGIDRVMALWRLPNRSDRAPVPIPIDVLALSANGTTVKLLGGLYINHAQANYIAQAIETRLGLRNASAAPSTRLPRDFMPPFARPSALDFPSGQGKPADKHPILARVMGSVFGLLGIAGGIYLFASVGELNRDGATVMSQVIRGLFAAWPLCVGILFVGVANNLKGDRASIFLFCAVFISGAAFFLLVFIYGAKPRYVTSPAVVNTVPAGAQITSVAPGRIFRDCDDCPEMVEIPPGSFMMGSDHDKLQGKMQWPVHSVTIAKAFAIGKTEITQGQWRAVMGTNPS